MEFYQMGQSGAGSGIIVTQFGTNYTKRLPMSVTACGLHIRQNRIGATL